MLTGKKAFVGDSITALIFKIITEEPAPLKTLDPSVPVPVERIIARALSKAPETRYATGRQSASDLLALAPPAALPTLRQVEAPTMLTYPAEGARTTPHAPAASTQVSPPTQAAARRPVPPRVPQAPARRGSLTVPLILAGLFVGFMLFAGIVVWWGLSRKSTPEETPAVASLDGGAALPSPAGTLTATSPTPEASLDWAGTGLEATPEALPTDTPVFAPTGLPTPRAAATREPTARSTPTPSVVDTGDQDTGAADDEDGSDRSSRRTDGRGLSRLGGAIQRLAHRRGERAAVETLGLFIGAQQDFRKRNGRYGSPGDLRSGQSLDLAMSGGNSFIRRGYRFEVNVESNSYSITARPMSSGLRSFAADQSGDIRPLD